MDGQMKKGILEMCILLQIGKREMYGYEIITMIKEAFPDVQEAVIYTILRRLHSDDYTGSYLGDASNGPPRKYYFITESGKKRLSEALNEWAELVKAVKQLGIE